MNEKERIIELVRQNVISMEEALDLLEAVGNTDGKPQVNQADNNVSSDQDNKQTDNALNDVIDSVFQTGKNLVKNVEGYFHNNQENSTREEDRSSVRADKEVEATITEVEAARQAEIEEIDQNINQLSAELAKREELLTITSQRLREIELMRELDGDSAEYAEKMAQNLAKISELEAKITELTEEVANLVQAKVDLGWQANEGDHKRNTANGDNFTEAARQFGEEASREGKKFGKFIAEKSKDLLNNFNLKDVNISFQVPWVKSTSESYHLEYPLAEVSAFEIEIFNGNLSFSSHEGDHVVIDADVTYFGSHEEVSQAYFESLCTILTEDKRFVFKVETPKVSVDAKILIPRHLVDSMSLNLFNGDIAYTEVNLNQLQLKSKNSDIKILDSQLEEAQIDLINGEVQIDNSEITNLQFKNLNGDLRVNGYVRNVLVDSINSSIYLSKKDKQAGNIEAKIVNGDFKLSLPTDINVTIDAQSSYGAVRHRLEAVEVASDKLSNSHLQLERSGIVDGGTMNIQVKSTNGDIYFKDYLN